MANVIKFDIDSAKKKLSAVKADVIAVDQNPTDYSKLNDEEFGLEGVRLAENEKKLHDLLLEVQSLYEMNHREFERHKDAAQLTLIDVDSIEYNDADGSVLKIGFTKETKTVINRAQLDKETGVQVSVTGNNLDLYTRPSVRARKKKVIDAVENGTVSSGCITTTTVEQGHFIFDETNKNMKGGE